MKTFVKVKSQEIEAKFTVAGYDPMWDGREVKSITCREPSAKLAELFDGAPWSVIVATDEGRTEYDNSKYSVPGVIIDNRDGTTTVKMGKPTDGEQLAAVKEAIAQGATAEEVQALLSRYE